MLTWFTHSHVTVYIYMDMYYICFMVFYFENLYLKLKLDSPGLIQIYPVCVCECV